MDFLPEIRLVVELKAGAYKDGIEKAYNKRVLESPLKLGYFVLCRTTAVEKARVERKLSANWQGPY